MVVVAQLVRALDCGSRGRRFEPGLPPKNKASQKWEAFFVSIILFDIPREKFFLNEVEGKPVFHPKKNPPFWGGFFRFKLSLFLNKYFEIHSLSAVIFFSRLAISQAV